MKVYISPSTQGDNIGVGDYGTERDRMNQLADIGCRLLEYNGFTVLRNKPEMTLAQVVADSNTKVPDIHVALHSNANDGKSRGCEVWAYIIPGKVTNSQALANLIYKELSAVTPTPDRGVKDGTAQHFAEILGVKATSVIVEHAFHDNPLDELFILQHMFEIAEADVKGICAYAGVTYSKPAPAVDYKAKYDETKTLFDSLTVKYITLKKELLKLGGE